MALAKMTWDELNELVGYEVSEPFAEYFAPMQISEEQKRKRVELAEELDAVFIALLSEYFYADQLNAIVASDIYDRTREEYLLAIGAAVEVDDYLYNHGIEVIASTIDVLLRHNDDPYYFSKDRARAIAENESNSIWNYSEFEDAVKKKHYKYKTWRTIMDGRERDSHAEVNGLKIPINDVFHLRGGDCYYPRNDELGMNDEEIVNCRCSLSFS